MKSKKVNHAEVKCLVIGDPHIRFRAIHEGEELVKSCIQTASELNPNFIVVLGDILDTHETAKVQAYKLAYDFIEGLSKIAHTYLLLGNHDLLHNKAFLDEMHFFHPLKKYPNVTVVDKPQIVVHGDKSFVMCPYVPPGRFIEALNTLEEKDGENDMAEWMMSDCIFCHQEFFGCMYFGSVSENGDSWEEEYPPVISGHLHEEQTIGSNIFYPGTPRQKDFDESPDKFIWGVTFTPERDLPFTIEKLSLGLKKKIVVKLNVNDVETFDMSILETSIVKLELEGFPEQLNKFRKSKLYNKLVRAGVVISKQPLSEDVDDDEENIEDEKSVASSFDEVLKELVDSKDEYVRRAYNEIRGIPMAEEEVELVFDDDPEDEEDEQNEEENEEENNDEEDE